MTPALALRGLCAAALALAVDAAPAQPAFPGAEGFGAGTVGGRTGVVVHVTTLADDEEGSLRWALEQVPGPRTVVFDVGGVITLARQILIRDGHVTIAGQTAPGEGITIEGSRIRIKAGEVIVRGLHMRPGDGPVGMNPGDRDGLMIGTTDHLVRNVVIDRNSFEWALDENVSINGRVRDVTFSNNIVGEALSRSRHPKGEHSRGLLVSNWNGADGDATRISIVRNLFTGNVQRNPEVRAGQDIEIVNNLISDYGLGHIGIALGGGSGGRVTVTASVLGNVLVPGRSTAKPTSPPIVLNAMDPRSRVQVAGNRPGADQAALIHLAASTAPEVLGASEASRSGLSVLDATEVAAFVLANAGAVNAAGRDAVDRRIVAEVARGTGVIVDTPPLPAPARGPVTGPADTDRDGIPDEAEERLGFDRAVADDKADADGDGFTNLEEYLNGLMAVLGPAR